MALCVWDTLPMRNWHSAHTALTVHHQGDTLPMRNWHKIIVKNVFLFFEIHYLWGIDTKVTDHITERQRTRYITYEELTQSDIMSPFICLRDTLPIRNWHETEALVRNFLYWDTLPIRNWHCFSLNFLLFRIKRYITYEELTR